MIRQASRLAMNCGVRRLRLTLFICPDPSECRRLARLARKPGVL
jgi:hypothetical protein